jgi:hypothetical protein
MTTLPVPCPSFVTSRFTQEQKSSTLPHFLYLKMPCLSLPTKEDMNRITKVFLLDLESFTITDEVTKQIKPVICCVCNAIPTKAQWSTVVDIHKFITLCDRAKLRKSNSSKICGDQLRNQYTAKDNRLKDFILSPETYVNTVDKVLVCKECLSELQTNSKVRHVLTGVDHLHSPSFEDT